MATNSRDINLVIKARDEATRGIESVTNALNAMFSGQEKVAGSARNTGAALAQAVAGMAAIDKAVAGITGATDRAEASFERVNAAIDSRKSKLDGLRTQYAAAQQAISNLSGGDAIVGAGRDQSGRLAQLEQVRVASAALQREIQKEEGALARLTAQVVPAASALQQLGSTEIAAKEARAAATRQIEAETAALRQQAEAAGALNAIRSSQYQPSDKSARDSADVFTAAGATRIEREIQLREENTRKIAVETAALAEQARIQGALERSTGVGRVSATEASGFNPRNTGLAAIAEAEAADLDKVAEASREAAMAEQAEAAALQNLMSELLPMETARIRYEASLERVRRAHREGKIYADQLAEAERRLALQYKRTQTDIERNKGDGTPGIFGLRPYEATNLGYQINDLITQIGSGTSVTQAFAQQGGQILQLFPKLSSGIVAVFGNPFFLFAAGVLGGIAAGFAEAANEAERLRKFEGVLASIGNGADYSAQGLERNVQAAREMGIAADEATASTTTLVREGINPERIDDFNRVAKDMSVVLGKEVPDAAKELAAAFTGGYDAIAKLDDATGFLTTTQREHIRTLFEEGRAQEARAYAFDALSGKMDAGADKMRGPWSDAVRELGNAWRDFTQWVSDLQWTQDLINALDNVAGRVARVIRQLRGARTAADIQADIDELAERLREENRIMALYAGGARSSRAERLEKRIAELQGELKAAQAEASGVPAKPSGDTLSPGGDTEAGKRRSDRLAEIARQKESDALAKLTGQRRVAQAGELAFQAEMRKSGDVVIANAERELAIKREQKKVDEEAAREAKKAAAEKERLAKQTQFLDPVTGEISSGFGPRKAPKEGASTFHKGIDYAVPEGTAVRAPAGGTIVEVGVDAKLGKYVYIDHGNKVVSKFGHLSDTSGVVKGQRVEAGQVVAKSGNTGNSTGPHLHYQVEVGGKPVDPRKGMFAKDGPARFQIDEGEAAQDFDDLLDKLRDKQEKFNASIDDENAKRRQNAEIAERQRGLTGDALFDAEREAAVQRELAQRRAEAKSKELELSADQEKAIRAAVELEYEQTRGIEARAKAQQEARDNAVRDLQALRSELQQQIEAATQAGNGGLVESLTAQLDLVNKKLGESAEKALEFYRALASNPAALAALGLTKEQIDRIKLALEGVILSTKKTGDQVRITNETIAGTFASGAVSALDKFAAAVAKGENVLKSLRDAFLQFAADFLRKIAQMIIQQIIFNLVSRALNNLFPGGGITIGMGGGGGDVPKLHNGGVVGVANAATKVSPAWFATAARYHTGGIAGLAADEVPAVLRKGEEVLTAQDPRHRANGGMSGGSGETRVINVFDSAAALESALATPMGGRAILNWVRENPRAFKAAMEG